MITTEVLKHQLEYLSGFTHVFVLYTFETAAENTVKSTCDSMFERGTSNDFLPWFSSLPILSNLDTPAPKISLSREGDFFITLFSWTAVYIVTNMS